MQRVIGFLTLALLLTGLTGCSYLFYPRAGDYAAQAKGASGVETMINLTDMMEATAAKAKGGKGVDNAFDDLHNQLHALSDAFCGVTDAQAKTPAYDLAVTHKTRDALVGRPLFGDGGDFQAAVEIQGRSTST